ncbi:MAG: SMI1/KNR4 family protein, partial [Planctomycetes bacterium]|nr:SMI1/KNR4 family protein [Planctomycetota bacterium]
MSVSELMAVVTPPQQPLENGNNSQWAQVQDYMEVRLPEDFRDFGSRYGTGEFVDPDRLRIHVVNPFSKTYKSWTKQYCNMVRDLRRAEGRKCVPYKVFPKTPGLLPWGSDDNGNMLYWLVADEPPEQWPVIVQPHEATAKEFERVELSMTSFLAQTFQREIELSMWPAPFFTGPEQVTFEPTPPVETGLQSLYDLYVENGNQADFWVQVPRSKFFVHVKRVHRKKRGPLADVRFADSGSAIVDYDDDEDLTVHSREANTSAHVLFWRRIEKPIGLEIPPEPKWKTIYDLYVENGNRAGFWVQQRTGWGKQNEAIYV